MNVYEEVCVNYEATQDDDGEAVCQNYKLTKTAPYGSCVYCVNFCQDLQTTEKFCPLLQK